jgi:hypothetical protein
MEFKCFTLSTGFKDTEQRAYGNYHPTEHPKTTFKLNDEKFEEAIKNKDKYVLEYIRFLALCHDVKID